MQLLKDVARQARFVAMQPGQITRRYHEQLADLQAFELAVMHSNAALNYRVVKAAGGTFAHTPAMWERRARDAERKVREIALQSEIILQRRAELAQADRAMLGILLGVAS